MITNPSSELLVHLLPTIGQSMATREPVRVWSMSGVERVTFPAAPTLIFKYAKSPFDSEDKTLRLAHALGIPVPQIYASANLRGWLGMLMEDLGPSSREPADFDGAATAVRLHRTRVAPDLPVMDQDRLSTLPSRALEHLRLLQSEARWHNTNDVQDSLERIARAATSRSAGAGIPPFGWVHSEFHPTSIHITGPNDWRFLDLARSFTGPGLLDLASWHGTIEPPNPARLRCFLEHYATAGGAPEVTAPRGGLAAENWALGWHRVWAVEWFMDQAIHWIDDPSTDPVYVRTVRRHLADASDLLEI